MRLKLSHKYYVRSSEISTLYALNNRFSSSMVPTSQRKTVPNNSIRISEEFPTKSTSQIDNLCIMTMEEEMLYFCCIWNYEFQKF